MSDRWLTRALIVHLTLAEFWYFGTPIEAHLFWYGLSPSIGYSGPMSFPVARPGCRPPRAAPAAPRAAAGAPRDGAPPLLPPFAAGCATATGASLAAALCSRFAGLPIFSPLYGRISSLRMMTSLALMIILNALHRQTSRCCPCGRVRGSLSTLHRVGEKFGKLDDDVLVELLVVDVHVELRGEHGLDEVLSIGQDDPADQSSHSVRPSCPIGDQWA